MQSASVKHASHAAQQLFAVHVLHAAVGVETSVVHEPLVGP